MDGRQQIAQPLHVPAILVDLSLELSISGLRQSSPQPLPGSQKLGQQSGYLFRRGHQGMRGLRDEAVEPEMQACVRLVQILGEKIRGSRGVEV